MRRHLCAVILIALTSAGSAAAQQTRGRLPLESFSVAQGLANDSVTAIRTDSRGFVWFGTLDGLSRYDGDRFVNYTTEDGIPDRGDLVHRRGSPGRDLDRNQWRAGGDDAGGGAKPPLHRPVSDILTSCHNSSRFI